MRIYEATDFIRPVLTLRAAKGADMGCRLDNMQTWYVALSVG
jgi:hypothetical protein